MAVRKKKELSPALKARDYKVGEVPIEEGTITGIKDVETKFDKDEPKTVLLVDTSNGPKSIFLNMVSENNLIDVFGEDDELWVGRKITTKIIEDDTFKNKMIVVSPKD